MHCSSRNGNWFEGKTEIQGNLGARPLPFPQKTKINAVWGYPDVNFMEIKLNFFVLTTTDWNHVSDNQVKAPILEMTDLYLKHHLTQMHTLLLSHLNRRLGPAMYAIKIKNCNITKPGAGAFQAPLSPHTFTPSSTGLLVQWPSSYWKVCRCLGLCSSFCFFQTTHIKGVSSPTRPARLPFTDTHSHLLAQPLSSIFLPWFSTWVTDTTNLSLSELLEHLLFLSRNMVQKRVGMTVFKPNTCLQARVTAAAVFTIDLSRP